MYKSQFKKIDPYDCFVVQGHIWFSKAEVITFIYLLDILRFLIYILLNILSICKSWIIKVYWLTSGLIDD